MRVAVPAFLCSIGDKSKDDSCGDGDDDEEAAAYGFFCKEHGVNQECEEDDARVKPKHLDEANAARCVALLQVGGWVGGRSACEGRFRGVRFVLHRSLTCLSCRLWSLVRHGGEVFLSAMMLVFSIIPSCLLVTVCSICICDFGADRVHLIGVVWFYGFFC